MKVLVACEFSGVVRDAFIRHGHDAISCDLLPSESDFGPHIQGDVLPLLREPWDLVIAHPPCQRLTMLNDAHPNNKARPYFWEEFMDSVVFFEACLNANAPRVAVENPAMHRAARHALGKASFFVQPWMFGHQYKKRTGFWTRGLPPLMATLVCRENLQPFIGTQLGRWRKTGIVRDRSSSDPSRAMDRSRFHTGIAAAMAQQWG